MVASFSEVLVFSIVFQWARNGTIDITNEIVCDKKRMNHGFPKTIEPLYIRRFRRRIRRMVAIRVAENYAMIPRQTWPNIVY